MPQPPTAAAKLDPDTLSWPRQLAMYLQLGFQHIVPEGADHILLVLGLFFLGITWRKLLSQTTVFKLHTPESSGDDRIGLTDKQQGFWTVV